MYFISSHKKTKKTLNKLIKIIPSIFRTKKKKSKLCISIIVHIQYVLGNYHFITNIVFNKNEKLFFIKDSMKIMYHSS